MYHLEVICTVTVTIACCCQEDTEENAEGGLSGAASGAEVVTAGASEGAEEATGEDTAQERWTPGQIHSNKQLAVLLAYK